MTTKPTNRDIALKRFAHAFTAWEKDYRANPEDYMSEAVQLLRRTPKTSGESRGAYFLSLLDKMDKPKPKTCALRKRRRGAAR